MYHEYDLKAWNNPRQIDMPLKSITQPTRNPELWTDKRTKANLFSVVNYKA